MSRMEEVLTFPCGFFFLIVSPLYLEELDGLPPCDTIFFIQDLDRMLSKSALSSVTYDSTASTGAFKHFFNYDTWKMS
jgi:hypothetical protein